MKTKLILSALAGLSLSAPALADDHKFTLEDVHRLNVVGQSEISPSGSHIAYAKVVPRELFEDKDGSDYVHLYLVDRAGNERPYITDNEGVSQLQWSADSQFIYFLSKRGDDEHNSLYRIAVNGGQEQKVLSLKDRDISRYEIGPDNQLALLADPARDKSEKELQELGFKAEVYEEGLQNRQLMLTNLKITDKPLEPEAVEINAHVTDIEWSHSGESLLVKTQPTPLIDDTYTESRWHLLDVEDQDIEYTLKTEGKLGDAEFSADDEYIAILGAQDKHDPATGRVYLAEADDGDITNWLPNFMGHVSDIEWSAKGNNLNFIADVDTESMIGSLKPGSSDISVQLNQGQVIASHLSVADDNTLALRGHTPKHPTEAFVLEGDAAKRLTNSNPWLADKTLAKQETLTVKARDGLEISGVLVYPADYDEDERYPLIMAVHGGPESRDANGWVTSYSDPGQFAASRGYAVFYPNYRGSTGKGVEFSKLGQNDYAGAEFNDLVDFKNALVEMGLVDNDRVGITGGSYGGYASAWGATKLTEHFAASVMFVGIANQLSKFGTTDISDEMHLVHARSYPWEKWEWYLKRSPIYWAGQSETPLLIMHGKEDPRVHPAQSMELYRYMKVQGKDVRLVYYPGEGHGNRKVAAQYDYSKRLMRWMDNYLMEGNDTMPDHELDHKAKLENKNETE
ncbi:Dipeptidyl-peptidase IV [Saliniradius amylolyticus]|uniref:Dipeptidyl-peptidase IV n=1 Tax=Saliniradius amylolyticus TaxID=2183582 RepID=A0A2S2E415_9ALTE|nr:S9 family peptidase [Saliniradius amylolyticus]AWL12384.1 Dipeptidyl-peptidase IV [Saliniradius amylolyticus]